MSQVKAKKKFGQNFLKDQSILFKIIQAIPNTKNKVVEVGPGLGDLTKHMVKYKDVRAYEIDDDLIVILSNMFSNEIKQGNLELIHTDVLDVWKQNNSLYDGKYDLIANLPYYIATNIILNALEDQNCEHIMVMIQKEVAEKFTATVGTKEYGSLAIITELIAKESKILFDVPPESFDPIPKVDSSILFIKKDSNSRIDKGFNKFLKAAFTQPRKKLSKNLQSIFDKERIEDIFQELDLNSNVRPHEVSASLYHHIYNKVIQYDRKQ